MISSTEARLVGTFDAWNRRLPAIGELSFAALWLAIVSGAFLVLPYDPASAAGSLQLLLLTNPAGVFIRGLHYWSGQLFLISAVLHLVEHLARGTERRVRMGVWLRLVLSTVVIAYVMVSGYVLKGDAEGLLARRVMAGLLDHLPLVGAALRAFLVGPDDTLRILYFQHAAVMTVLAFATIVEHFRRPWPKAAPWLAALGACAALAIAWPPALHDPASPVVKGPWYMLGLQEILHWLSSPGIAWLPLAAGLLLLALLPKLPDPCRRRAKGLLAVALGIYLALIGIGYGLRGADWEWRPAGLRNAEAFADPRVYLPDARVRRAEIPVVRGQREGCLACHAEMQGIEAAHAPQALGCSSCHLGHAWSGHAGLAHAGMAPVPGDLSVARQTCGTSDCHASIVARVDRSLMANAPGFVGVDRFAFGEATTPDGGGSIRRLAASAADSHLDELCAGCHLAVAKARPGPISELSRGGGCTACHLHYEADTKRHPTLTVKAGDEHCFGCHSRSGRISTSYAGWHETQEPAAAALGRADRRLLADGRVFERREADVHHAAGMACVDCHTAQELMGDGRDHRHEEEAIEIACEDCHTAKVDAKPWDALDPESQAIVRLRMGDAARSLRFLTSRRSGLALTNAFLDATGQPVLQGKIDGRRHPLKPPARACTGLGHDRVTCSACHSAWVPQCTRCHTQRASTGDWQEMGGDFRAEPPTLGVRGEGAQAESRGRVQPFAPGMILTLGTKPVDLTRAFTPALAAAGRFERLFAPVSPHTTTRAGRSCASCHADPLAIGVGRGRLVLEQGHWAFHPSAEPARDGLPADAWTAFLADPPAARNSTRTAARPFTAEEQRRILRVGACLPCHAPTGAALDRVYQRFADALKRVSPRCVVP